GPQRASYAQFAAKSDRIGAPVLARPRHIWMNPDVYQRPLMLTTAHTVYWSGPSHPGGTTSGQLCFVVNSNDRPEAPDIDRLVIRPVAGQFAMSGGELYTAAVARLMASPGAGPPTGGGGAATGCSGVVKANVCENGPALPGSNARACQKYV